jgi:hypothetical protein
VEGVGAVGLEGHVFCLQISDIVRSQRGRWLRLDGGGGGGLYHCFLLNWVV